MDTVFLLSGISITPQREDMFVPAWTRKPITQMRHRAGTGIHESNLVGYEPYQFGYGGGDTLPFWCSASDVSDLNGLNGQNGVPLDTGDGVYSCLVSSIYVEPLDDRAVRPAGFDARGTVQLQRLGG